MVSAKAKRIQLQIIALVYDLQDQGMTTEEIREFTEEIMREVKRWESLHSLA